MELTALFLGILEGLTEFIPVSSTGHLILAVDLLGFEGPPGKVFEIFIQLGAILAVMFAYRRRVWNIATNVWSQPLEQRFVANILLAFLPAAIIGLLAHGFIKSVLFNPLSVSVALVLGGVAMLIIEKKKPDATIITAEAMDWKTALKIGLFQCMAMIPGVSRAGATIMGALLCRVERTVAAEFSFFLAIPTMLAATAYDLYKNRAMLDGNDATLLAIGFVAAFATALLVVRGLVAFVSKRGFAPFAYYRIALGSLMLVLLLAA
jgi:undecaprenyl-diphosphatase